MTFQCLSGALQMRKLCFSFFHVIFMLVSPFLSRHVCIFFPISVATQSSLMGSEKAVDFYFFSPVWLYLVRMMQCCPQDVTVSLTSLQTRRKYVRKHFTSRERILGGCQQSRIIFLGWRQWGLDCAADHSSVWRTALQTAKVTTDWAHSLFFPHSFISFHFMETWKIFI